jgi:hypothetical protein
MGSMQACRSHRISEGVAFPFSKNPSCLGIKRGRPTARSHYSGSSLRNLIAIKSRSYQAVCVLDTRDVVCAAQQYQAGSTAPLDFEGATLDGWEYL